MRLACQHRLGRRVAHHLHLAERHRTSVHADRKRDVTAGAGPEHGTFLHASIAETQANALASAFGEGR
jgi:hypothetical protein